MVRRWTRALALLALGACGDDEGAAAGQDDAGAAPRDASAPMDAANVPMRDASSVPDANTSQQDATLAEAATAAEDASVGEDTATPVDASTTSSMQPSIPKDSLEPVCFPLRSGVHKDDDLCLDAKCVPGSFSGEAAVASQPGGFWCRSGCNGEAESFVGIDGDVVLNLDFRLPITPHSSSAELRAALARFSGQSQDPYSVGFVGEPSLIEELRNENGRLHVSGWGMVTSTSDVLPTLPYVCGHEAPTLCTFIICEYGSQDGTHPLSWFHFDVEAPFTQDYYGKY